ncbi:unnamed protein product [Paramecium sonneborni]|uniref:Uncharacterized protein n=1 Tax=Paramecium sonneborni TaxID=65129 RepID=A0A8S1R7I2_9CILI|nr:unnamed protein product [Paramecium sonneborni]
MKMKEEEFAKQEAIREENEKKRKEQQEKDEKERERIEAKDEEESLKKEEADKIELKKVLKKTEEAQKYPQNQDKVKIQHDELLKNRLIRKFKFILMYFYNTHIIIYQLIWHQLQCHLTMKLHKFCKSYFCIQYLQKQKLVNQILQRVNHL